MASGGEGATTTVEFATGDLGIVGSAARLGAAGSGGYARSMTTDGNGGSWCGGADPAAAAPSCLDPATVAARIDVGVSPLSPLPYWRAWPRLLSPSSSCAGPHAQGKLAYAESPIRTHR
uniref:Uncharacterized protein n=1 Tax=Leersia perrieri TaxID=77586 RepID=A0A0D9X6E5_9ORYZ